MPVPEATSYTYSSLPKPIKPRRKAAGEDEEYMPINIMADPRVFRGSMFSIARTIEQEQRQAQQQQQPARSGVEQPEAAAAETPNPWYSYTPAPFAGTVDITSHLVEKPYIAPQTTAETQTDAFQELPEPAPYVPTKTGIDASTTIENQSELFVFDEEVKPLLDILVRKTLEQALYELESEAELEAIKQAMDEHHQRQAADAADVQQREQETIKEFQRFQAVKKAEQEHVALERVASRKLACVQCARFLYSSGLQGALSDIRASGLWERPQKDAVTEFVEQQVLQRAQTMYARQAAARAMMRELLEGVSSAFASQRPENWLMPQSTLVLRINLKLANGNTQVGSVELNMDDTVETVEQRIKDYISRQRIDAAVPDRGYLSKALKQQVDLSSQISSLDIPDMLELIL